MIKKLVEAFKGFKKDHPKAFSMLLWVSIFCLCFAVISVISTKKAENESILEVSFNDFMQLVQEGKVDTVYYSGDNEYMYYTLYNAETIDMPKAERDNYVYPDEDKRKTLNPLNEGFRREMLENDVNMVYTGNTAITQILSTLFTLAVPILWIVIIMRMMKGMGGLKAENLIGKSNVKFENVIGHKEVLEDVQIAVKLLKDPTLGEELGVKPPKGFLLSGDPGVGKTLIAKAIAGEAGVPFITMGGSDFKEMFVGVGAKRVRDLFKVARENAPCVVFIDEVDSAGANREGKVGSNQESDDTVNALLAEMDGFTGREGIFVLAATNHPEKLDKAFIRAGRFDREIHLNPPKNWRERKELFDYYLGQYKLVDDIDIENISKQTSGFTGADIEGICNDASIIALKNDKKALDNACLEEAIDAKVFNGNRSKSEQFKDDKIRVAYHEAGHAIMTYLCGEPIARASIIGTTSGVGGAVFGADKDTYFETKQTFESRVKIAYAGRASEEIKFNGDISTGASNDITQATSVLVKYVEHYGFDKDFGLLDISVLNSEHFVDSKEITKKLSSLSNKLYKDCISELQNNYILVETLAQKLLEVETISGEEIENLLKTFKE